MALQENDRYIGRLLVKDGVIDETDLGRGLEEQKKTRDFLCSVLVRLGFASEERIFSILSLQVGVPFLRLKDCPVDPTLLAEVQGAFALAFRFMPIKTEGETLVVAMADPLNEQAAGEIKGYLGYDRLKVFLSGDNDIREAIRKYYGL
jgi:type IV pilus assembly protein PilB